MAGPDETESNRLSAVYDVTAKAWNAGRSDTDDHLAVDGRVLEMLSEHTCQGWLEGYLLTGRHGVFSSYEAFVHIVDSMVSQHAMWLKTVNRLDWRRPIPSLNYLLTSHVWRQDHNGFSHQDPGFIDHVVNKKAEVVRVCLPPDTNTLLSTMDHCLRTRNYVNVVVAGKQPQPNWLDWDAAALHRARGIGVWDFASNDGGEPDVVMACAGDVPTLETLAAVDLLREHLPQLAVVRRSANPASRARHQLRRGPPRGPRLALEPAGLIARKTNGYRRVCPLCGPSKRRYCDEHHTRSARAADGTRKRPREPRSGRPGHREPGRRYPSR
ncbi:hypothetical protein [Kribbella catacumbae]|uniref:phosphoketolase family protein n=1 Tax=Kribbella catacumbae TaxID=460086 RepID=UPI0003A944BE|nr:hypothetical protein [Kribbella catacumbae]